MFLPKYYEKKDSASESLIDSIKRRFGLVFLGIIALFILIVFRHSMQSDTQISPLQNGKGGYEVFGFAPHWTFNKLDNVDFNVLTTFAYFGIEVLPDGNLDLEGPGYETFQSDRATKIFKKAHAESTRVVLTLTQMDNDNILAFLEDKDAQETTINQATRLVKKRGIDGINIDFEYIGNPGVEYRERFSDFVYRMTKRMHKEVPSSKVSVSVYASAVKDPKIYDIAELANSSDGIFMMAYDFATAGSDHVIPTAPLNGHKEGKYWYDISTAVDDFLAVMPSDKLILGLPWYGYNYPVQKPEVKAEKDYGYYTYYWWRGYKYSRYVGRENASAQTYASAHDNNPAELEGWDEFGKVGWRAYKDEAGLWRMIFLDDAKSLAIKYDFAKAKNLGGVGMWALGFDDGKTELWDLLLRKFGAKARDIVIANRRIY